MYDAAFLAMATLFSAETLLALGAGVVIGLVVGVLPGLGGTAGLALLLPFVFGMEPDTALAMMIGLTAVTTTSDTFPSVLMGIPGTSGSQATVLDGFPMSKRGEGTRALSAAFVSSLFGGIFGAFVLSFAVFFAKPIILKIGFGEQLMLVVLALSMVGILTGTSIWKGLAACSLGLMLGALGAAPLSGVERATLGFDYLLDPVPLVIVGLAMFATPEIIDLLRRQDTISESGKLGGAGWLQGFRDWANNWWLSLRCSTIGCIIGALPGLGGSVVDWIAYGHAVQTTKNRESYGTGDVRGVVAPESANNAKEGGALIPTLLLGIPGSGSMAILLGGLILIGIEPGAELVEDKLDLVYLVIFAIAAANVLGAGICFALSPQIAKLTTIRYVLLAPFMFGIIFFAAFQATRSWGDLIMLFLLSTLGVYMKRFGWSRPALLIGFVLSVRVETSVYQATALYGISFLERPIVQGLVVLTLLSVAAAVMFKQRPAHLENLPAHANSATLPQWLFLGALTMAAVFILQDGMGFNQLTGLFPMVASISALAFMAPLAVQMIVSNAPNVAFFDAEKGIQSDKPSAEFFLGLLAAMLILASFVGFVLGIATFIFLFLWLRGGVTWWKSALGAGGFVLFLGVISDQLTLRYPTGLLQNWITLPWPLQ